MENIYLQKCGNKLESNDSFCIMCGTNNKSNQEEQKQLPRYNEIINTSEQNTQEIKEELKKHQLNKKMTQIKIITKVFQKK